jgi:hypothetical protein
VPGATFMLLTAALVGTVAFLPGCSTDTEEPSFNNPFDPVLGAGLPVPESVAVMVGDNTVHLTWSLPEGETAEEYAIFRQRIDPGSNEQERLLERVTGLEYTDTQVRNGRAYAYRLAAGVGGQFGQRTEEIEAAPGLFAFVIANGGEYTRARAVSIDFSLPSAQGVQLSETPGSFTEPWLDTTSLIQWTLSSGDGEKTVYARFRLVDGAETLPVFDTIRLDTNAAIQSFTFDGQGVRQPGDTIHFRLVAGEPHGLATVSVAGVFDAVPLFDDGTNGDDEAGDGTYERSLAIPSAAAISQEEVVGAFRDEAGNAATAVTAPVLLTIRHAPEAVDLLDPIVAEPPDDASVRLRWSPSQESAFTAYRVFRSVSAPVDSSDELIRTITSRNTLEHEDTDVVEGKTYHYRVYVQDTFGQETGSNTIVALVANVRPPAAVNVTVPGVTTTSRVALQWSKCEERDFSAYRVYRNTTGAVSESDPLVTEIDSADRTSWDDSGLQEDTLYYYRVYVVDTGGWTTRSNEVQGRTENATPAAVTLRQPTATSTTRVALDWSAATESDFLNYRIYRNMTGTVSNSDSLIATITDVRRTYWDDPGRRENTRYYYRVYTTDQSGLFARSNEVEARTKNDPPPAVSMYAATGVDSTSATLTWGRSNVHDFAFYRLYRDEISAVTTSSTLVSEMDDPAFTSIRDAGLESGTRYYYRVFVVDDADDPESTGSNTITLTTP